MAVPARLGAPRPMVGVERFAFYERARTAFALVRTLERRPYGNVFLKKGVLTPDGELMTPESAGAVD